MKLMRIQVILAATLAFVSIAVLAEDVQWSGTITGQGTDIGQLLFDQWAFSYAQVNPRVDISFTGGTSGNAGSAAAVSAVTAHTIDFANSEQPLQPLQRNLAGQDITQFPIAAVSMVFTYNLPYGGMMDKTNQTAQLVLNGEVAQLIWVKNITKWNDPRLLAIQTPAVRSLLPNANITLVVRSDSCSANNFIQGSLRNFSTTTWPYGSASQTWSTAYRNDVRVLSVAENTGAAALVSYTKNSLGYVALTASTKNVRYAAMINANGDLVRTANLTAALAHPYAVQTFHPSTRYTSTALLNSRAPNAWPMGGYTFAIMRMKNTTLPCERRREMLLFFNWILSSQFEQKRMSVYGFQSLGDPILQNVLQDLRSTPLCKPNTTSPIEWAEAVQHEPSTSFQAVVGANITMLILTVILFAVYISDNFKGVAASARVFQVVLFTGGILNYISLFYFYQIPKDDSICQARLWLSAMGFTLIFSSLACRGYQILAVSQLSKKVTTRVPHMVIIGAGNTLLAGVQIIILLAWNQSDPFKSQLTNVEEFRRTTEYICRSENATAWWGVEIAYAIALLSFCLFVAYLTWDLKHMVQESKWMSISIYNAVVVLGISLALHMSSVNSDDAVFWVTGTVLFMLNTSVMLAMFGPKVYNRLRSIKDPENASGTSGDGAGNVSHMSTSKPPASQLSTVRASSKMGPRSSSAQSPNSRNRGIKTTPRTDVKPDFETHVDVVPEGHEEAESGSNWESPVPNAVILEPVPLPHCPAAASPVGVPSGALEVETVV